MACDVHAEEGGLHDVTHGGGGDHGGGGEDGLHVVIQGGGAWSTCGGKGGGEMGGTAGANPLLTIPTVLLVLLIPTEPTVLLVIVLLVLLPTKPTVLLVQLLFNQLPSATSGINSAKQLTTMLNWAVCYPLLTNCG